MKFIHQNATLTPQVLTYKDDAESVQTDIDEMFKHIELVGRTCYRSTEHIKGKHVEFVERLAAAEHYSPLEHGSVYLNIPYDSGLSTIELFRHSPYAETFTYWRNGKSYTGIITNYRFIVECNLQDEMRRFWDSSLLVKHPELERATVTTNTSLQVTAELERHRTLSPMQESSRYCNYSKGKFGNELTYSAPIFYNDDIANIAIKTIFEAAMKSAEHFYFDMLNAGATPQDAAKVLPKATKSTYIMTGDCRAWANFLYQRYFERTGKVLPEMKELATQIYELFKDSKFNFITKYRKLL